MAIIQDVTRSGNSSISVKIPTTFALPSQQPTASVSKENTVGSVKKTVPPMPQFKQSNVVANAQNNIQSNLHNPLPQPQMKAPVFASATHAVNRTANKPWMPFHSTPAATFENRPSISATEKAIEQLEVSYDRLLTSINLKLFRPEKINQYIVAAEKRSGMEYTDEQKDQIRAVAKSGDENSLRLLALELRVGVPKKYEREALSALGELMLHRHNTKVLEHFLDNPSNDENLKAHIRTILMVNRVESAMLKVDNWKRDLSNLTKGITSIFGR